jgi:hypothetical protein
MVQATECQQLGDLTVTSALRPRHLTVKVKHRTQLLGLARHVKRILSQHTMHRARGPRYRACWLVCLHTPAPCVPNGQFDLFEHAQRALSCSSFYCSVLTRLSLARLRERTLGFFVRSSDTCPAPGYLPLERRVTNVAQDILAW